MTNPYTTDGGASEYRRYMEAMGLEPDTQPEASPAPTHTVVFLTMAEYREEKGEVG